MSKKKQQLQPIDMPIYNYWQALYKSFYSRRLYVDIAKRWHGYGFLYLLLAIAIAAIPVSAKIMITFNQYFQEKMLMPLKELPPLYVQNGSVSFDKPMPYLIKNKKEEVVGVVDTTGKNKTISNLYPAQTILITKNTIYFRPPKLQLFVGTSVAATGDNIYTYPIEKNANEVFVGDDWSKSSNITKLYWATEIIIYPIVALLFFGMYFIFILVFAFLGQLCALLFFRVKLKFNEASRLFAVAATPQIFCFFIILMFNFIPSKIAIFYIALFAIYFFYAVSSLKRERNKLVLA